MGPDSLTAVGTRWHCPQRNETYVVCKDAAFDVRGGVTLVAMQRWPQRWPQDLVREHVPRERLLDAEVWWPVLDLELPGPLRVGDPVQAAGPDGFRRRGRVIAKDGAKCTVALHAEANWVRHRKACERPWKVQLDLYPGQVWLRMGEHWVVEANGDPVTKGKQPFMLRPPGPGARELVSHSDAFALLRDAPERTAPQTKYGADPLLPQKPEPQWAEIWYVPAEDGRPSVRLWKLGELSGRGWSGLRVERLGYPVRVVSCVIPACDTALAALRARARPGLAAAWSRR